MDKVASTKMQFETSAAYLTDVPDDASMAQLIAPWDGGTGIHFISTHHLLGAHTTIFLGYEFSVIEGELQYLFLLTGY